MANEMAPGNIIWKQIPLMTKMAVGAREAVLVDNGMNFKAGRSMYITILLDPSDTYTVEAFRLKRGTLEKIVLRTHSDVYAEDLGEIIYRCVNR